MGAGKNEAAGLTIRPNGIPYVYVQRPTMASRTRKEFFTVAPVAVETKARYGLLGSR
jgi:hypothetical protein